MQRVAIAQLECDQPVAGNDVPTGILQRLAKLINGPVVGHIRQVGADRRTVAED